jgi:hypothetical protein
MYWFEFPSKPVRSLWWQLRFNHDEGVGGWVLYLLLTPIPTPTSQLRTVFLMDTRVSMSHLLHECKNRVDTVFESVSEIWKVIERIQIHFKFNLLSIEIIIVCKMNFFKVLLGKVNSIIDVLLWVLSTQTEDRIMNRLRSVYGMRIRNMKGNR